MSVHKHEEGAALLFLCGQKLRKCLRHPLSTMEQTKGSLLHCCSNSSILYAPIWLIETILSLPYCFDSGGYHPVSASSLLFFLCWNWPRCCSDISWFIGWILTLELTKPCTIWLNTDNRYKILNSSSLISILCHLVTFPLHLWDVHYDWPTPMTFLIKLFPLTTHLPLSRSHTQTSLCCLWNTGLNLLLLVLRCFPFVSERQQSELDAESFLSLTLFQVQVNERMVHLWSQEKEGWSLTAIGRRKKLSLKEVVCH